MPAGRLKVRALFETITSTPDGGGGSSTSWGSPLTLYAQLDLERGIERLQTGRIEAPLAGNLRVRYSQLALSITEADRVTIESEVYNIRSIRKDLARKKWIDMTIEKGVAI